MKCFKSESLARLSSLTGVFTPELSPGEKKGGVADPEADCDVCGSSARQNWALSHHYHVTNRPDDDPVEWSQTIASEEWFYPKVLPEEVGRQTVWAGQMARSEEMQREKIAHSGEIAHSESCGWNPLGIISKETANAPLKEEPASGHVTHKKTWYPWLCCVPQIQRTLEPWDLTCRQEKKEKEKPEFLPSLKDKLSWRSTSVKLDNSL